MVLSWLLDSLDVKIRNSVSYFSTTKEILDDLAIRFSQTNMPRVFQLRKEIASISLGSLSITAYFTKFCTLIAEIDTLNPIPRCTCLASNCTCANAQNLDKYEDMIKLSQFLMGLNEHYTDVRGQLLMMQPTPTNSQAFSLLLQEESQREFSKSIQSPLSDSMAMNVKYNNLSKFKNFSSTPNVSSSQKRITDNSSLCDYCNNVGHTRDKCFCPHGYPDWHRLYGKPKPKPKRLTNQGSQVKSAAHVSSTSSASTGNVDIPLKVDSPGKDSMMFTDAQCQ